MLALATPVVMAELGWVAMGIVDTIMVGGLGPGAIGAVGLASMLFIAVGVFAMGLLLGLDPLVAQAFGARRLDECHRWLVDGVWLGALITPPMIVHPLPGECHTEPLGPAAGSARPGAAVSRDPDVEPPSAPVATSRSAATSRR